MPVAIQKEQDDIYKVVISKEIVDRDGEIVLVKGINFPSAVNGVPLIDAHNMNGSVVENVLGRVYNLKREKVDGISVLTGEVKFAETPRGFIARMLVEGGFVDSVSIGFGVKEYDPDTKIIQKSELYETSLVAVPANPEAKFDIKKALDVDKDLDVIEKKLNRYNEIAPVYKEICKTFLSDTYCKSINYEKTGNLILDICKIYEVSLSKFNTQEPLKVETPQEEPKVEQVVKAKKTINYYAIGKLIAHRLDKKATV